MMECLHISAERIPSTFQLIITVSEADDLFVSLNPLVGVKGKENLFCT
jgi:hypothetical protein